MAETLTAGHQLRRYDTGDNPGADNLNANWDDIDRRLIGIGDAFPTLYPTSGLFLRRDLRKIYENIGGPTSPNFVEQLQGAQGPIGPQGVQGFQGFGGPAGADGAQGFQGDGIQGAQGPSGGGGGGAQAALGAPSDVLMYSMFHNGV